jgi:alpha-mannosidase
MGITISSSVAVWDYINMTHLPTTATLLQPVLLASRQSCHGLGPLYHQRGSHSMEFSIFTHEPGWVNGYKSAVEANEPLIIVVNPVRMDQTLPEAHSFLTISSPSAVISTLKKEEYGNGVVLRVYDSEGKDQMVEFNSSLLNGKVFSTNLIEDNPKKLGERADQFKLPLGHHSIETLLIRRD